MKIIVQHVREKTQHALDESGGLAALRPRWEFGVDVERGPPLGVFSFASEDEADKARAEFVRVLSLVEWRPAIRSGEEVNPTDQR